MFENVRADLRASIAHRKGEWWQKHPSLGLLRAFGIVGVWPVMAYRFGHWATKLRIPVLGQLMRLAGLIVRHAVMVWTGVFIHPAAEIGPGLMIHTWLGIFVGTTRIGSHCTLSTGVLIGHATRSVGDNVYFGAGAKVIADTKIGNNVVIMPNSLIMVDVPDNTTIAGVPARIKLRGGRPQRFEKAKPSNGRAAAPSPAPVAGPPKTPAQAESQPRLPLAAATVIKE